jgi:hypothetical protein
MKPTMSTVIAPYATPIDSIFFALVLICLICGLIAVLLASNKILSSNRNRGLLSMLAGFTALVTLCAVIFTLVHASSIQPIVFDQDTFQIGSNQLKYSKIEQSYIKPLVQKSRYSSELNTDTAMIFVIEMRDGSSFLLSNDNYDLRAVDKEFKSRM